MATKDLEDPSQVKTLTISELNKLSATNVKIALKTLINDPFTQQQTGPQQLIGPNSDITSTLLQLVVKVTEVLSKNADLQEQLRDLKECNAGLIRRIETLEDRSGDWSTQQNNHSTAHPADVSALTSNVADELQQRKEKEMNLVIDCLPEANDTSDSDPDVVTKQQVDRLLHSIDVANPKISRVFRMGRKTNTRPRPIKVFCEDLVTRSTILAKCKNLKNLPSDDPHRKVFIRSDLTQLQRNMEYKQRQERKRQDNRNTSQTDNRRGTPRTDNHQYPQPPEGGGPPPRPVNIMNA